MNRILSLITLISGLGLALADATPLAKNQISAEAKWLLHCDLDNFRGTKIGAFLNEHFIEKHLQQHLDKAASQLKIKVDLKKIRSVTAYGVDYEADHKATGVLLVQSGQNIQGIIEEVIQQHSGEGKPGLPLKRLGQDSDAFYALADELFAYVHSKELLVVGKSKDQIEKARQVLNGKSPNLAGSDSFAAFTMVPHSFFFLAVADALDAKAVVPPQAKVLQMAEGGRIVLGERLDKLFLDLSLRAKTAEVTAQIQQIIQGTVALVSLS